MSSSPSVVPATGPIAEDQPLSRSPVTRLHAERRANLEQEAGWLIPVSYGDVERERRLLRERLALADVTARAKIDVRGRLGDPEDWAREGERILRISERWALLVAPPQPVDERVEELAGTLADAMVTDATHLHAAFALVGPLVDDAVTRLSGWDPRSLEPGHATAAPIAEIPALLLRGDLGVPVLEIYLPTEFARYGWRTILEVVQRLGGGLAGWSALRAEGWS